MFSNYGSFSPVMMDSSTYFISSKRAIIARMMFRIIWLFSIKDRKLHLLTLAPPSLYIVEADE